MAKLHSMYVPHARVQVKFDDEVSMTRQEFADESDINIIMQRYEKTGVMPTMNANREPQYFDVTDMPTDFREAMDYMIAAEDAFMSLPATVRRDMGNDPANFVEFASKPENLAKMREWGLAPPAQEPAEPLAVRVVSEPAPGSAGDT